MEPTKKTARIAGAVYLVVVLSGIFHLMYVPTQLIVKGDAQTTFNNIVNSEVLYRWGILAGFICYLAFLLLPLVLYKLLSPVEKTFASLMVLFVAVSIPISFINMINKLEVLTLISNANYLKAFQTDQLQAQVMLCLDSYSRGNSVATIFWGLWLLPFGYLVVKSGFLPKVLGYFLIAGCFGYIIDVSADLVFPAFDSLGISSFITMPGSIGEIGICLWLLIVGIRIKKTT